MVAMNRNRQRDLYAVMSELWAKAPLEYLATTHHAIVSRFEDSFRYVSLHRENAKTFSYEFASILRDAGSVFGSFSDAAVRASNPTKDWKSAPNIGGFFDFYAQYTPDLATVYIEVRDLPGPRRLQPFWGWTRQTAPAWWNAHNDVKHSEYNNAVQGNLQNATNAVAAVEIVLRCATQNEKGTRLFSPWGANPAENIPLENIPLLFEP